MVKEGKVEILQTVNKVKDLGIAVDSRLTFKDHIHDKVNKAYSMLGVIRRNFKHVDKNTILFTRVWCEATWNMVIAFGVLIMSD